MPRLGRVYVNRTLNMKRINYIGLDMDHTIIRYHSDKFEELAHRSMIEKLIKANHYPTSIRDLKFDYNLAIRGLVVDKMRGNLLKLSRHSAIRESFHGLSKINYSEQNKTYESPYIDLNDSNYEAIDTTFSISFATLFAQLVELKDTTEIHTLPEYSMIATQLIQALDAAHTDGTLKNYVRGHLDQFIIKDPELVKGLENYVKHGKKVFVITNSDYFYTKLLLDYAINPYLKDHESWMDLFEFTVTLAQKPRFFHDKLNFLKINPADRSMTNTDKIEKGGIYQGGCAETLTASLNLVPENILYIGDHIYGDILKLKKHCSWRTALVIEELKQEIESIISSDPISQQVEELMAQKIPLENDVDALISEQITYEHKNNEDQIHNMLEQISNIDGQIGPLLKELRKHFNIHWGEVFRTGIEESYFAYQVERFACIYMAKLNDLMKTSPRTYFRSTKKLQAHELE